MAGFVRPEKMHRVQIYCMKKDKESVLNELQKKGAVHISEKKAGPDCAKSKSEAELIHAAVKNTEKIEKMKSLFSDKAPPLISFFEEEHEPVRLAGYTDSSFRMWSDKAVLRLYNEYENIASLERQLLKQAESAENANAVLRHFEKSGIWLDSLGEGKYVFRGIGKMKIGASMPDDLFVQEVDADEDSVYVFFSVPAEKKSIAHKLISVLDIRETGTVKEAISRNEKIAGDARMALKAVDKKKCEFEKNKPLILAIEERWQNIKARETAAAGLTETKCTVCLEGWVPESSINEARSIQNAVVYSDPCEEREFAPTKLKNSPIFRPYEIFTRNHSLPKYGEVDPTIFVAVAFTIFFGFMFMDMAYSVMLIPFSILMMKKGTKPIKDIGHIFLLGAISGTIFGILGGSALGNFITFNSYLDAYKKPFALIFYALIIGTIHMNIGFATKLHESFAKKDAPGTIDALSWIALEAGALLFAFGVGMSNRYLILPGALSIAWSLSVRLKDGFAGMIGAIDFFGNILSYIRLMALALLTSWIAFVINLVTGMISGFSFWLAVAFFSLAHVVNFVLNIVSSSLHGLRLNYVEFFGTFYEGGGTEYKPLEMQNTYHKTI